MIVKCPKCRFKYETPVAPGVKELSCVCSRCGFPFTYAVPEDVQNEVHQESTSHTQQPSSNVQRERYNNRPDYRQRKQNSYEPKPTYEYDEGGVGQEYQEPPTYKFPASKRQGCARQFFIVFIIALVFLVFGLRHYYYEKSYTAESLTAQEMPKMTETNDLLAETPREESSEEDEFVEVRPERPPQWLQGSWTVDTPEGPINIFIKGNHIAESFKGETQSGTFYYADGKLFCNFGNNEETVRLVNLQRQQIDAGGGLLMEKRDY